MVTVLIEEIVTVMATAEVMDMVIVVTTCSHKSQ